MNGFAWALVVLAAFGVPHVSVAETRDAAGLAQTTAPLSAADQTFMTEAVRSSWARLRMSEVALERATSEEVEEFARRVVEEETAANEELSEIATQKGVLPPSGPSADEEYVIEHLGELDDAKFESEYMAQQVDAHETGVILYQTQLDQTADEELRAFAEEHLAALQERAEAARAIAGQLQGGTN